MQEQIEIKQLKIEGLEEESKRLRRRFADDQNMNNNLKIYCLILASFQKSHSDLEVCEDFFIFYSFNLDYSNQQQRKKEFERRLSEPKELQQQLQQQHQHHSPSSTHNGDSAARQPSSSAGPSIAYNSKNYTTPPKDSSEAQRQQQQQQLSSDTEYLNTIRQSMEIQKRSKLYCPLCLFYLFYLFINVCSRKLV